MKSYVIAYGETVSQLEEMVFEFKNEGYQPKGKLKVVQRDKIGMWFGQVMVKAEVPNA